MEAQKSNKLPEGVGKKIVEALKQQDIEINEVQDEELEETNKSEKQEQYSTWDTGVYNEAPAFSEQVSQEPTPAIVSADDEEFDDFDYYEETVPSVPQSNANPAPATGKFDINPQKPASQGETIKPEQTHHVFTQPVAQESVISHAAEPLPPEFEVPANVEVLRRLISQLPAGVTRQTGAQIIRQTMEAMGLSINSVLSEAQMVQENLGETVRESVNTIEEYKNNMKILERKIQSCRKQADRLGELINLFILSENKR